MRRQRESYLRIESGGVKTDRQSVSNWCAKYDDESTGLINWWYWSFLKVTGSSIVKEYFCNSLSWNRITLDDTTYYELQRTMSDPRRFHVLKKFSINIVVSSKLDFECDPRCAKIKITFTRDIESSSIVKKTIFILRTDNHFSVLNSHGIRITRVNYASGLFLHMILKTAFYYSFVVSSHEYVSFVDVPRMHSLCDE